MRRRDEVSPALRMFSECSTYLPQNAAKGSLGVRLLLAFLVDRHAGRLGLVQPLQLADESHRVPTHAPTRGRTACPTTAARPSRDSRHQLRASTRLCTRLASASAGRSTTSWTRAQCPRTSSSTSPGSSLPRTRTRACLLRRCFDTSPLLYRAVGRGRAHARRSLPATSSCRPSSQATCLRTTFATLSTPPLLRRPPSSGTL